MDIGKLKSTSQNTPVSITFVNMSSDSVEMLWWNYGGNPVSCGIIPSGANLPVNTYETHPWTIKGTNCKFAT